MHERDVEQLALRRLAKAAAATTAAINHVKKDADQLAIAALIIGARRHGVPGAALFSRRLPA
jgi:hypothetical protein